MKCFKFVAFATAISLLTGCNTTGDSILGKDKEEMNVQSTVTMDESNVNALSAGQIDVVYVKEGDFVKKGDPLVLLNSDTLNAQKEQTLANIEKAQAALKQQQVTKAQAEAGKAKAQAAVEQAQAGKSQAEASVKSAQASYQSVIKGANKEQLEQLRSSVKIAETNKATSQTAFNDAETELSRAKELYNVGGMAKADFDKVQTAYTTAKNNLDNASQNLEIAKNKLKDTENGATQENKTQAQAGIDQAKAGVAQAQASVSQASAGVSQADTSIAAAQTAIEQAEASIKQLQISLGDIEKNIEKCTLKAPVDGVVTTVNVKKGDMVTSGLPTVVVTDIYNPYITCNIDEYQLDKVDYNMPVKIKLSATGDKTYEGTVVNINKQADFATKKSSQLNGNFDILTYAIKVEFNDEESVQSVLRAGMTAFVDFGK